MYLSYVLTVKHDQGKARIQVTAQNEQAARRIVMSAEHCPESAIVRCRAITPTIYQIKQATAETSPKYFDRNTLRFFGQTLRAFSVYRQDDGRYLITAPRFNRFTRRQVGRSERYFNPATDRLESR